MQRILLISLTDLFFWVVLGLIVLYLACRFVSGHGKYRDHKKQLEREGLLRSQNWVRVGFRFSLLLRTTFCHVHLSKRRLILFHYFTRGMVIQAPLGAKGSAGKEGGRFEVDRRGNRKVLTFRTSLRGGGRVRIYVKDADAWLKEIIDNE
ncbi:MAG: hypothetical protein ACYTG7_02720 [Planctomycetota bacterium]